MTAMHATCDRAALVRICGQCLDAQHVQLAAEGAGLTVSAATAGAHVEHYSPAHVEQAGAVVVDLTELRKMLRRLPGYAMLDLHVVGDRLHLVGGAKTDAGLPLLDVEVPAWAGPFAAAAASCTLAPGVSDLLRLLNKARSYDAARSILQHVLVEPAAGDRVRLVVTDGHALAHVTAGLASAQLGQRFLIPPAALHLLAAVPVTEKIACAVQDTTFTAQWDGGRLLAFGVQSAADFPDYRQIVPGAAALGAQGSVTIGLLALCDAIERFASLPCTALSSDGGRLRLAYTSADGRVSLRDEIPATFDGWPEAIGMSARVALPVLRLAQYAASPDAEVTLYHRGPLGPLTLDFPGDLGVGVIMPMRLD